MFGSACWFRTARTCGQSCSLAASTARRSAAAVAVAAASTVSRSATGIAPTCSIRADFRVTCPANTRQEYANGDRRALHFSAKSVQIGGQNGGAGHLVRASRAGTEYPDSSPYIVLFVQPGDGSEGFPFRRRE